VGICASSTYVDRGWVAKTDSNLLIVMCDGWTKLVDSFWESDNVGERFGRAFVGITDGAGTRSGDYGSAVSTQTTLCLSLTQIHGLH